MAAVSESPVGDSALSSMLEEFEEGTLLSLLEDSDLFSYLHDFPLSPNGELGDVSTNEMASDDLDLSELFGGVVFPEFASGLRSGESEAIDVSTHSATVKENLPDVQSSPKFPTVGMDDLQSLVNPPSPTHSGSETDVSSLDSNDSDIAEDGFTFTSRASKRLKIETKKGSTCSCERDGLFLTACVKHDHCYTSASTSQQLESAGGSAEKDILLMPEEGNNSDTGYETMSTSTSPGGSAGGSRSAESSPTTVKTSPLPPPALTTRHLDPVALIDARIKYFMRSQQVSLTEEEKETLKAEGLPIPTTLPLTKVEEKALKSVRRKIRNKVAAQESRKRKKEHMQELEDKVRHCTSQNLRLQKKVESLESENRSLMAQLQKFQALVAGTTNGTHTTKVGACLMVIVLCFALFLGGWAPQKHAYWTSLSSDYAISSVRSRSLLSLEAADTTFPRAVCDWFRYTFLPDPDKHIHTEHSELPSVHKPSPVHTWPDIYLSSYTPLTVHSYNDSRGGTVAA